MTGQNRVIAMLLGVLAVLVLAVGGFSAVLLLSGGDDNGGSSGVSSPNGDGDGGSGSDGASATGGRLRLSGSDPVTLDPHLASDTGSAEYLVEIFSGLYTVAPDLTIVPDLAEDFPEVSADGLTYTVRLRDDVVFHRGRRVTADDVKWSIERSTSRELASSNALAHLSDIAGVREHFAGATPDVSGITVVDERTIQFRVVDPIPPALFLAKLTHTAATVVDRMQVESNPNNWTRNPNGTGPYRLVEWRLGERLVLEANDRYHLGAPQVREVVYLLSGGSALTRFENGELDVAFVGVDDLERARDPGSELNPLFHTFPLFQISFIAFNTSVPPFDDPDVRRALAMSIDRVKIAEVTFNNAVTPATGILAPGVPGYVTDDRTYGFDPDAARAALAASTYGSAENLPRVVMTEVGGGAEARIDTQAFQEQWRTELGIDVEIRQTDFATYIADVDAGRLQMFNGGAVLDQPDPDDILYFSFHSASAANDLQYHNPQVDDLLERARTESEAALRLELFREAERIVIEDAVWVPLYFSNAHVVVNADVEGWFEPPMVIPRLRFVRLNR